MANYRKWWDGLGKVVKIILSIFGIFLFLYRLFIVIEEKAEKTEKLIYLILNVVPIIGTVIVVIDIIWMALGKPVPTSFADLSENQAPEAKEENVVEAEAEDKEEEKPAE